MQHTNLQYVTQKVPLNQWAHLLAYEKVCRSVEENRKGNKHRHVIVDKAMHLQIESIKVTSSIGSSTNNYPS